MRVNNMQRRKNLRSAFQLVRPLSAQHVTIVGEIITTASTVNDLVRILKTAGVGRVDVWRISRAL